MHPTILVVDDDKELREALAGLFRDSGYAAETAASGEAALAKLKQGFRPCIIVLDVLMPDKNGFMFHAELSSVPEIAGIPLIAHSGVRDIARYAVELEAKAFVRKPAKFDEILATVRKHCLK